MSLFTDRYGKLALVTGASTGIGRECALQLAAAGMDLIIAARDIDKLEKLASEIRAEHKVEVNPIRADLGSMQGIKKFIDDTGGFQVDLLINNAGAAVAGSFLGSEIDQQHSFLMLNVEAPVRLTHHFGRGMAARGKGGVLFVGSIIGYGSSPWMAHYAGTKNFLTSFVDSIRDELVPLGVDVALLSPGPTKTPMTLEKMEGMDMTKIPMVWMEPAEVARIGLEALPESKSVIAGFANTVMTFMMSRLMPRSLSAKMFGSMMGSVMTDEVKDAKLDRGDDQNLKGAA